MDNPETKENHKSLGLFQESFKPVTLHVDTGFDFNKIIYKQTLMPLSEGSETIILKIGSTVVQQLSQLILKN